MFMVAGGYEMLAAAKRGMVEGGSPDTNVIAITQLTSTSEEAMKEEQLVAASLEESVINYAKLAKKQDLMELFHQFGKLESLEKTVVKTS